MEHSDRPRIAVIGTGVAGLSCGWGLREIAHLTLFESEKRPGGHVNTVTIQEDGKQIPIDTGFIVFNKITYPNLCRLFDELGISTKPSEMSFSVQHHEWDLEYNGMGIDKLFAQRRNLFNPRFLRLIPEIMRFFRIGRRWLKDERHGHIINEADEDIASFCKRHRLGPHFLELYLVPMSSAVWSTEPGRILDFPISTLLHFFQNHGFLGITTHHPWFTVDGGARTYVDKILQTLGPPRLGDPVVSVEENSGRVLLTTASGTQEFFDAVVLATHADQSLRLLKTPTSNQKRLLASFNYQQNDAQLHTDASIMPKRQLAWASWNFRMEKFPPTKNNATTHYWMNALQKLPAKDNYFVSLNSSGLVDKKSVVYSTTYEHPVFTLEAIRAQMELPKLNHDGRLFFCGSYFRYGFHEDACKSGFDAATAVKKKILG